MYNNYSTKKAAGLATITLKDATAGECEISVKQFSTEDGTELAPQAATVTVASLTADKATIQAGIDSELLRIAEIDTIITDVNALLV